MKITMSKKKHTLRDFVFTFEFITLLIMIIIVILIKCTGIFEDQILNLCKGLFVPDVLSPLVTFFSITCGAYLTVITIISTSVLSISEDMLKRNLEQDLLRIFVFGMFSNLFSALLCSIGSGISNCYLFYLILFASILLSLILFVRFVFIMVAFFKLNLTMMVKDIDKQDKDNAKIKELLRRIEENTRKTDKQ